MKVVLVILRERATKDSLLWMFLGEGLRDESELELNEGENEADEYVLQHLLDSSVRIRIRLKL